jgi:hypothetical protein
MMTAHPHVTELTAAPERSLLARLWLRIAQWSRTCADYSAASADYERLSGLSDAELERRGVTRQTLARHLVDRRDRGQ